MLEPRSIQRKDETEMADNPAFKDEAETDFGGVDESRKSEIEITVESAKNELEDGEIPAPYAGMPAEVLLLHSRKKGWVIGRLIGWLAVITAFGENFMYFETVP